MSCSSTAADVSHRTSNQQNLKENSMYEVYTHDSHEDARPILNPFDESAEAARDLQDLTEEE